MKTQVYTVRVYNADHTVFENKLVFARTDREAITKAMNKVNLAVFVDAEVVGKGLHH